MNTPSPGFVASLYVLGALLLIVVLAGCSAIAADERTYTRAEVEVIVGQALEYGRQNGIAEVSAAIEETRATLERCAIARPI